MADRSFSRFAKIPLGFAKRDFSNMYPNDIKRFLIESLKLV